MESKTYALGGRDGGSVFDCPGPGLSSVMVGDREGRGGGGARSYLYVVLGTAFIFISTGRRPVSVRIVIESLYYYPRPCRGQQV